MEDILKEKFERLLENNKDKDWNDPTFRQTIINAFRLCSNTYYGEQITELKAHIKKRERIHLINLECARKGAKKTYGVD